ncbi:MAG: pteridine reductase [Burkholderiaceae bacterium]
MGTNIENKVILITGGAKRVGAAICRLLHSNGANLMIHYRSSVNEARALQSELNLKRPNSVAIIQGDLLNLAVLPTLIQETVQHFGKLDVLINNASSYYSTELGAINEEAWQDLMGSNLKAPLFLSQAAANELRRQQGCIVNITDMHVERPKKGYIVYSVAKSGLVTLTKSLAHELGPDVRVNAVAPGPTETEMILGLAPEMVEALVRTIPIGRLATTDEVASAIVFLVSDRSGSTTGETLNINGGAFMI